MIPRLIEFVMQKRQLSNFLRRHWQGLCRNQLRRCNDNQFFARDKFMMQVRPSGLTIPQRNIHTAGTEVDNVIVGIQEYRNAGVA